MWALSLALYVKSGRTPWVVNGIHPDTAFAGIGYSVMNGPSGSNVVVGCSHIYSSDGRGMKYKLSKIQDYSFDRKKNPYLSEEEAYRIGLNIKELFYKSFLNYRSGSLFTNVHLSGERKSKDWWKACHLQELRI